MTAVSETWRYVDCGDVDAFENNAQMAVLARSATDAGQPILQTSVWGATHLNVGWFDDVDSTVVVLDGEQTFRRLDGEAYYIYWGAYLGTPDEILVAGKLSDVRDEIEARRDSARRANGWIMDTYLLRKRQGE